VAYKAGRESMLGRWNARQVFRFNLGWLWLCLPQRH